MHAQAPRWSSDYHPSCHRIAMRTPHRQPPPRPEAQRKKEGRPKTACMVMKEKAKPQARAEIRSFLVRR